MGVSEMKKITRRRFFIDSGKKALAGTAVSGVALSPLFPSRILGANERVNLALIGCGGRGELHVRGFIDEGAVFTFVCDPHAGRMEKMAQLITELQGKSPKKVRDMRTVIDSRDVDAVVIATPNHWHALPTIWACQAEKDVYLEKPQSNTIWEGRKMIEAARKYKRIVQIGAQNRSAPYVLAAREYIRNGKLGDIHLVKVFNLKSNAGFQQREEPFILGAAETTPEELDWKLWIGGAKFRPFRTSLFAHHGWIAFWDYSAGDMDDAIHQIDIALMLMEEPSPSAVSCSGGRLHFPDDDAEVPDTQVCVYDFDGFVMTLELSGYPRYMQKTSATIRRNDEFPYWTQNATRVELYGSNELMIIGRMGGGWIAMTSGGKVVEKMYGRVPDDVHRQNFLECLKSRQVPNGDIETVNNSTNVVHISNIAYRVGNKKLIYDSRVERFVGCPEADELLSYPYRGEYRIPETI